MKKSNILIAVVVGSLFLIIILMKFFVPASWADGFRSSDRNFDAACIVSMNDHDYIFLSYVRSRSYRRKNIFRVDRINIQNGEIEASYYAYGEAQIHGVSNKYIWVNFVDEIVGLDIEDLEEKYMLTDKLEEHQALSDKKYKHIELDGIDDLLRIKGLDGYEYSYDVKSNNLNRLEFDNVRNVMPNHLNRNSSGRNNWIQKKAIGDILILDGSFAYDNITQNRINWENGDYLIHHRDIEGNTGNIIVSKFGENDELKWSLNENEIFSNDLDYIREIKWMTLYNDLLYFIFFTIEDDEVCLAAIDPETGKVNWIQQID